MQLPAVRPSGALFTRTILSLMLLLSLAAGEARALSADDFAPLVVDGKVAAASHGLWQSRGYGRVLRLQADSVELIDVTSVGCMRGTFEPEEFAQFVRRYAIEDGVLTIADLPESTAFTLDPIDEEPASCARELEETPKDTFDYFYAVMDELYAFFDLHEVDWKAQGEQFRSRVGPETTERELYEIFTTMLEDVDDGHLSLTATIDGERERFAGQRTRTLGPILRAEYHKKKKRKESMGRFQTDWFFGTKKRMRRVLGRSSTDAAGGNVLWGRIGDVGYITVYGMGGFDDDDDASIDEEVAAVHRIIGQAVTDLADTRKMIVDVTLNQGGLDDVGRAIASHFAAERTFAYDKQPFRKETPRQRFYVEPAEGPRYLKPVILVTSDVTVSAAETFTMSMRSLPNVTHVGTTTMGALSDILDKTLPNGWDLAISHEIYLDHEGVLWEGKGIPPAREITIWDPDNVRKSHAEVMKRLAAER